MSAGKKSLKIFIFGIISQVVTLFLGIVIPRLLIVNYGSEINGLLASIKQIFVYVALLEAGIGTAALQAMYAPVAKDDKNKMSQIMAATDHYFKRTGILYAIAVIVLAIVYSLVVKTEISNSIVIGIILLQGASGVIKYFFQGKLTILLRVDGKSYVTTNAATIVNVTTHFVQIILILSGCNVLAVQIAYFIINLLQMFYISYYVKKNYAWLDLNEEPDYKSLEQSKFVIVHQLSGLIFNNTDVIILTYFCGLKTVSIYALYSLIFSCVANVIDTICSSVEFILGQAFNSDRNYFMKIQEVYETYYLAISFCFFTITLIMFPSFIKLYSAGVTDADYLDAWLPILFTILYVLMYARRTSSQIINFSGTFKETQWRSIIESIINLSVSLIMVQRIGIYGVLLGTIAALIYRTNDVIIYANCNILGRKPWKTYRRWLQNTLIMVVCVYFGTHVLKDANDWFEWAGKAICVSSVCFASYLTLDSLFDIKSFRIIKENGKKMWLEQLSTRNKS